MDAATDLQNRIKAIVKGGDAVRQKVAAATASAARVALDGVHDLVDVVHTTTRGASEALADVVADEREKTLREVVEGLGDGLETAAQAAELTLREARTKLMNFAREDRDRLATAFESMSRQFVDSVATGARLVRDQGRAQVDELGQHASATLRRIEPSVKAAVGAARDDPAGLVKGALDGAVAAARGATGALFTAIASRLAAAGDRITPPREPKS